MKFICKKCGSTDYKIVEKSNGNGIATGLYCAKCGQWQKWLNKQEKVLFADDIKDNLVADADKDKEIARLKAENAELKARIEKAIELPCKVGDTVYSIENFLGNEFVILKGRCDYVAYEDTTVPRVTVWATFEDEWMLRPRKFYGKGLNNLFTSHVKAEQRLAELQEEEK